jgi:hypothetical protein
MEDDMDPASGIAMSLALGAAAVAGKELVNSTVKDAYAGLKSIIAKRLPKIRIAALERDPSSPEQRANLERELSQYEAGRDHEVITAAQKLLDLVEQHAQGAASIVGVNIKDVRAANLRLRNVVSSGTGIEISGEFTGDIDIEGVVAGNRKPSRKN